MHMKGRVYTLARAIAKGEITRHYLGLVKRRNYTEQTDWAVSLVTSLLYQCVDTHRKIHIWHSKFANTTAHK